MKVFTLTRKQIINLSPGEAWNFFSDPRNLSVITPPWLNFEINSQLPGEIYPGMIINYKVSPLLGIKMNWITEITHVNKPFYFVDEQRFGPYKFWHHQHHLKEKGNQTEVEDIVHYGFPAAGGLINKLIVSGKLKQIFNYRKEILNSRFNSPN